MGLDTYARYPQGHPKFHTHPDMSNDLPSGLFPDNHLCGGMFSGGGNSFRGKVYASWVEFATGHSLYTEELSPDIVQEMASWLDDQTPQEFERWCNEGLNTYEITYEQTKELSEWFGVVAKEKGAVYGWW